MTFRKFSLLVMAGLFLAGIVPVTAAQGAA